MPIRARDVRGARVRRKRRGPAGSRRSRGAAMTEAAIISPVFFALALRRHRDGHVVPGPPDDHQRDPRRRSHCGRVGQRRRRRLAHPPDDQSVGRSREPRRHPTQSSSSKRRAPATSRPRPARRAPRSSACATCTPTADFARPQSDFDCTQPLASTCSSARWVRFTAGPAVLPRHSHERARLHRRVHRDGTPTM